MSSQKDSTIDETRLTAEEAQKQQNGEMVVCDDCGEEGEIPCLRCKPFRNWVKDA